MNRTQFATLTLLALGSAAVLAATDDAVSTREPVAGRMTVGVAELTEIASGYRASKLIGSSVYNDDNRSVGKVGDLILLPDGTLSYAIVDVGGFLGVGRHHVAIPVSRFTQVTPRIVLPGATRDALKNMPEFKYSR